MTLAVPAAARPLPTPQWLLGVLLVLLLLALPLVCVVHCRIATAPAHQHGQSGDPRGMFLCDLPPPSAAHTLFTPSFLPGLSPLPVRFLALVVVLTILTLLAPPQLHSLRHTPPNPPPRWQP